MCSSWRFWGRFSRVSPSDLLILRGVAARSQSDKISRDHSLCLNFNLRIVAEEGFHACQCARGRMHHVYNAVARLAQRYQLLMVEPNDQVVNFDDVGRFRTHARKGDFKVRKCLLRLCGESVGHLPFLVHSSLARDENQSTLVHNHHMAKSVGLAQLRRILELHLLRSDSRQETQQDTTRGKTSLHQGDPSFCNACGLIVRSIGVSRNLCTKAVS